MYYSYLEIEYVATSFSPARTDLALKLLTLGSSALLLYPQQSCACTMILFTTLKNPWWTVSAGNTTYLPMLLSDTCVSLSQYRLSGVDKGQRHCTPHCLRKDTPFSLGGGPVSLPVGTSETTHSLRFTPLPKTSDLPFLFLQCYQLFRWAFSSTRLWAGRLLWCGSCSLRSLLLWPFNLRFCPCHCWTLPLHVKTSTFTNTNWQNGLKTITITTSFFLWRFFLSFG